MPIVHLGDYISRTEIQQCADHYQRILAKTETQAIIHLVAREKLLGFDPLLVAYFMLFKRHIPWISIVVELPYNDTASAEDKAVFQLMQMGTYAFIVSRGDNVFRLVTGEQPDAKSTDFNLKALDRYPYLVYSQDYFPALPITASNEAFDILFDRPLAEGAMGPLNQLPEGVKWSSSSEKLRGLLSNSLLSQSSPKERTETLLSLARTAFYHALSEAKILSFYFQGNYELEQFDGKNRIQAGSLINKTAYAYFLSIKSIFDELSQRAVIYHFVFSSIVSTSLLTDPGSGRDVLNDDTRPDFTLKLHDLWEFTKDLVSGIKEIAKNIKDHADPKFGAIVLRIFQQQRWEELQQRDSGSAAFYRAYAQKVSMSKKKPVSYMDINIIDLGATGVRSTLIINSRELMDFNADSKVLCELIGEDIGMLETNQVSFQGLMDSNGIQLNQQSKRSICHFGLLTFSKLICRNDGLMVASTAGIAEGQRENAVIPSDLKVELQPIALGTNFRVILPIRESHSYTSHLPHQAELPTETSAKEIKGIETLLAYQIHKLKAEKSFPQKTQIKDQKHLVRIVCSTVKVRTRAQEQMLWEKIAYSSTSLERQFRPRDLLICLDLEKAPLNESQVFRLLGNWELHYPSLALMLVNLPNDTFQKMVSLNEGFVRDRQVDYWNANIATVVYSYILVDGRRFHFADVLWGSTRADFLNLNSIVEQTSFNSTAMLNSDSTSESAQRYSGRLKTNTQIAFFNKNTLLPFDLVVESTGGSTLFEQNVVVLLHNKIST